MEDVNLKKRIIIGLAFFLIFVIITYFLSHSFLIISSPKDAQDFTMTLRKEGQSGVPQKVKPGLKIVSNGKYTVEIISGISITRKDIKVRPFHISRMASVIEPQKAAKKIARGASECLFGDPKSIETGTIYSYSCNQPPSLFKNEYQGYSIKSVVSRTEESTVIDPQPYGSGLLFLRSGESENSLVYSDSNGEKIRGLGELGLDQDPESYKLAVDGNIIYLLDGSSGSLYTFQNIDGDVKKSELENLIKDREDVYTFRASKGLLYILTGYSEEEASDTFTNSTLSVFSTSKSVAQSRISLGSDGDSLIGFNIIKENLIGATSIKQTTKVFKIDNNDISEQFSVENSNSSAALDESLYVVVDGDIYKYNQKDNVLNLEFGSEKVRATKVQAIGEQLLFNGVVNTESNAANQTYVLQKDSPISGTYRLEDQLPYGDKEAPVAWMDYFENNIYVVLALDSLRNDPRSGQYIYDQSEFNQKRKEVEEKLNKDGFTAEKYNITFAAY